jgi:hypothetical protein
MGCTSSPTGDDRLEALRSASRELLDAEEAHRMSPTLDNASRLARARRAVKDALDEQGEQGRAEP